VDPDECLLDHLLAGPLLVEEQACEPDEAGIVLPVKIGEHDITVGARQLRPPVPRRRHVGHHHRY
jgi:hypothetical protein